MALRLRLLFADSKLHLVSLLFTVILNGVTLFIRAKGHCLSEVQEGPLGMYDFQGCQKELKQQDQQEK